MNPDVDPYEALGISRDASPEEIRDAYRHIAKEHHPDVSGSPSDSSIFREATEAYESLAERTRSDDDIEFHRAAPEDPRPRTPPTSREFAQGVFGSRGRRSEPPAVELAAVISPAEAAAGGRFPSRVAVPLVCPSCHGDFFDSWFCGTCGGTGEVDSLVDVVIHVPPGVKHGSIMRVPLAANTRFGDRFDAGDLEVTFLIDRRRR